MNRYYKVIISDDKIIDYTTDVNNELKMYSTSENFFLRNNGMFLYEHNLSTNVKYSIRYTNAMIDMLYQGETSYIYDTIKEMIINKIIDNRNDIIDSI